MSRAELTLPVAPPAPALVPRLFRVVAVRPEIPGTVTIDLAPTVPAAPAVPTVPAAPVVPAPPGPAPGQFMMLSRFGLGEAAISMSGRPDHPGWLRHTIRAAGPLTRALASAAPGDLVGVRGPFGTGWDLDRTIGRDVVVVAGGIGLAPLRPVVHSLLAGRAAAGRVVVLVGARSPADLLYAAELHAWRARFDLDVLVTVDRDTAGWGGDVGVVSALVGRIPVDPANTVAFVCGPEVMMRFTAAALTAAGIGEHRIEVSLERNMRCGVGLCGHCQLGPVLLCRDGPVVRYDQVRSLLPVREV